MPSPPPDWDALRAHYPPKLVDVLRGYFDGGPFKIRARQLATQANTDHSIAETLLQKVAGTGALTIEKWVLCPCDKETLLTAKQAGQALCPACERAFGGEAGGYPEPVNLYINNAPPPRDVRWVLALHGMNTTGTWQEEFNWLVSRSYRYSVPVAIYKYGIVRPGAILKFRQKALTKQLAERIRRLSRETENAGFGGVPDVIAHSFGTWLLGHALKDDPSLKVGRVLLTGCILRPDFDWQQLITRGQVEAVLCHTASRDIWAGVAHYIIPDSGPSGRRGFNDRTSIGHATLRGGKHSDFFNETTMANLYAATWRPFLTKAKGSPVDQSDALPPSDWTAAWLPFRATLLRYFVLALFIAIGLTCAAAFALGARDLWFLGKAALWS